jgi:hypothetical protein
VNDIVGIELLVAFEHMLHEQECFSFTESSALLLIKIGLQVAILTILEKQIKVLPTLEVVV